MNTSRERPFDRITADCIRAKMPLPEKLATQFERIASHLNSIWGTCAAGDYLDELIFSERTDRSGFPPDVATEIVALKRLHQQKYVAARDGAWDSYENIYEAKSTDKAHKTKPAEKPYEAKSTNSFYGPKSTTNANGVTSPTNANGVTSITSVNGANSTVNADGAKFIGTANSAPLSLAHTNDAIQSEHTVRQTKLRPARQRRLAILRLFPGSAPEPTAMQSRPVRVAASDRDEILEDAEMLLADGRLNSSIGLFERLIALHPGFSAYPYLRLLELYYELGRRSEFEPVAIGISKHFECKLVRWIEFENDYWAQLDQIADELAQTRHHLIQVHN